MRSGKKRFEGIIVETLGVAKADKRLFFENPKTPILLKEMGKIKVQKNVRYETIQRNT